MQHTAHDVSNIFYFLKRSILLKYSKVSTLVSLKYLVLRYFYKIVHYYSRLYPQDSVRSF